MEYKVGDKVIIREWDDMEREFGVDSSGDIKAACCFVKPMRDYCGKKMTIGGITCGGNYTMVNGDRWIFSADTFEKNNNQKIVITTDGTETLARLYEGDKVVKKATAKCSPDDTFDFNVGAKLAFERLMNVEKWIVVNRKPKVGDYVRLVKRSFSFTEIGDILKVDYVYDDTGSVEVLGKNHPRDTSQAYEKWLYASHEIEVVEPVNGAVEEKKEEYYNGKVVCVGLNGCNLSTYTVGKIYQFVDGQMTCDNGSKMPSYKHVKNFEEWDKFSSSDFVEIVE